MRTSAAYKKFTAAVAVIIAEFDAKVTEELGRVDAQRVSAEEEAGTTWVEAVKGKNPVIAPEPLQSAHEQERECKEALAKERGRVAGRIRDAHGEYLKECMNILGDNCSEMEPVAARTAADAFLGVAAGVLEKYPLYYYDCFVYNGWMMQFTGVQKEVAPEIAALFAGE